MCKQVSSMVYCWVLIVLALFYGVSMVLWAIAQKRHGNTYVPAWPYSNIQPYSAYITISQQLNFFIGLFNVPFSEKFHKIAEFSKKISAISLLLPGFKRSSSLTDSVLTNTKISSQNNPDKSFPGNKLKIKYV